MTFLFIYINQCADGIYFNKAFLILMYSKHFNITLNGTILLELGHVTLTPILSIPIQSDHEPKNAKISESSKVMPLLDSLIHRRS